MKSFILGLIVACIAIAAVGWIYFKWYIPVSTSARPIPFEQYLANTALDTRASQGAGVPSPIQPTEANLLAGAKVYRSSCFACHDLPGEPDSVIRTGMYPEPPKLLEGKGVTDDPVGRTRWVVENGIRLTGMPSFRGVLTGDQLWQVSLLLAQANDLPPAVQKVLAQPEPVLFTAPQEFQSRLNAAK